MGNDAVEKMSLQELFFIQSVSADQKDLVEILNVSLYGEVTHAQVIRGFLFKHVNFEEVKGIENLSFEKCHFSYCRKVSELKTKDCVMVNILVKSGRRCPPPSLASPVSRRDSILTSSFDNSGFSELCAFDSQKSPVLPVHFPFKSGFFGDSFGNSRTHSNSVLSENQFKAFRARPYL